MSQQHNNNRRQPHYNHYHRNQSRREFLLRQQEAIYNRLDEADGRAQTISSQAQAVWQAEQRLVGRSKPLAAASIILAGGSTDLSRNVLYMQSRIEQEKMRLQSEMAECQSQRDALIKHLERIEFELSLLPP